LDLCCRAESHNSSEQTPNVWRRPITLAANQDNTILPLLLLLPLLLPLQHAPQV
jgi:hypothetical protein